MARYQIIDEPQSKAWAEKLIVNPILILFASILVPLIWQPPMAGRYWIPILWLIVNGYALGSSTLGREIITLIVGALAWLALLYGVTYLVNSGAISYAHERITAYLRIGLFAVFFLTLYLVVFRQAESYALYTYLRGRQE